MSTPLQRTFLTTREAAAYVGFKTTSAIRKALLEGRIHPVGRRGGNGPWMFEVSELNRFLRGEPFATVAGEHSGASGLRGHHEEMQRVEIDQGNLHFSQASDPGRVAAEGGRICSPRESEESPDGSSGGGA